MSEERRHFLPGEVPGRRFYGLLAAVVLPRPIAWISSRSPDGVDNLAPYSFFTVASTDPPVVQFTSVGRKDTLRNIEATGEFVVNLASEELLEQVNASSTDFPAGISEFDALGIAREPSSYVAPSRVASSPVAIECRLRATTELGDSIVTFGDVLAIAVAPRALRGDRPAIDLLRPLGRLAGGDWALPGDVRSLRRPKWAELPPQERPRPGA